MGVDGEGSVAGGLVDRVAVGVESLPNGEKAVDIATVINFYDLE